MPAGSDDSDERVREITEQEAENLHPVLLSGYAVQSTSQSKKVTLSTSKHPDFVIKELTENEQRQYLEIIDFDDHFADVANDWTNPDFE